MKPQTIRTAPLLRTRARAALALALPLALGACDAETAALIEEIDAAREGCSEEQLKTSDEACVQMFERYAEMGEDAIETYIGGMRALDEALRRRGGIQFDTAGLGSAISDSFFTREPDDTVLAPDSLGLLYDSPEPYSLEPDLWTTESGTWETAADRDARLGLPPNTVREPPSRERPVGPDTRRPADAPPRGGRGVLLPPDERLRRPWIGDEPRPGPYLGDGDRRPEPPTERPAPEAEPLDPGFREPIPPYPRR